MTKDDVLKVAGEPYGWFDTWCNQMFFARHERKLDTEIAMYTEAQLLAVVATTESRSYAAGAADMKERAAKLHDGPFMQLQPLDPCSNEVYRAIKSTHKASGMRIRALPIVGSSQGCDLSTNTEGEHGATPPNACLDCGLLLAPHMRLYCTRCVQQHIGEQG